MSRTIPTASRTPLQVFEGPESVGAYIAAETLARLERAARRGTTTLGCPGGRSLRTTYAALGRLFGEHSTDLRNLHIVMMDEYVEARGERWVYCPADAHYSCRGFGDVAIRQVFNAAVSPAQRMPARNVHAPDPNAPDEYEALLERLGGIDVFLLASGATDGHVAFNPQGTALGATTRVVELSEHTRRDNLGTFPRFRDLAEVPHHGVTVGPGTIVRHSRAAIMALLGSAKGTALRRISRSHAYDRDWPASVVVACTDAQIVADEAAVRAAAL
ncbi:MAG TPA: 6-phosphogluconolactonase [Pseudomonadales bacterium]|nr:6-phosphogluconolactonase [Pseudomonadales bacterium]